ncbi:hypothetical protein F4X88_12600 [Candidatus Poribacteria bacterium]|nr:hypothetical protein [Candidatus Poribacteria bacterium]MYA57130.1 hypothetical protein [Candidatus Poribacteria bacterium]
MITPCSTFRVWKFGCLSSLLVASILMLTQAPVEGYIAKRYTIRQIVAESTNVVFGTVSEVNVKRRTAKVKVEENLKGTSEFKEIRIRFDVYKGEADHRDEIIHFLKAGEPVIVFYLKAGGRIDSLAHTRGRWFQTQVTAKNKERTEWGWWLFTHFEKYLNRDKVSRRDSTPDFQEELRNLLSGDALELLLLKTDRYDSEQRAIAELDAVADFGFVYHATTDRNLPALREADILWIGFRSLSEGRYRLNRKQENRIKNFVKNGGIVIASGQDSDKEHPCGSGWLPEPLRGVESPSRNDFQTTSRAGELFKTPNRIRSGQLALDDSWRGWNEKYEILATTNAGKEIVVAKLKHGKGMYIVTNLRNQSRSQVSKNRRMLENLVHFAVRFLEESE